MRLALAKLGLLEEKRYNPAQGYAANKSDLYRFGARDSVRVQAEVRNGRLDLPAEVAEATSALLKVNVRASLLGTAVTPHIEFRATEQGTALRHSFDRGAAGVRYLDVSDLLPLVRAGAREIHVAMRHMGVEPEVELLLFRDSPTGSRVLVLAAHPDDAEIAAFGLYKTHESAVVTITAGDAGRPYYGHIYTDLSEQYELKRRVRVWDSLVVPMWGGVHRDRVANLGYFDGTIKAMHDAPDRAVTSRYGGRTSIDDQRLSYGERLLRQHATPTWHSLVLDLQHILEEFSPTVVATPHPLFDAHTDHRFTTIALFDALQQGYARDVQLLLYVNHAPFCGHWPFGPPADPASLPPWPLSEARIRGFYSQPLSRADQVDKLFALESMHDLRRPPPSVTRRKEWRTLSSLWELRDAVLRQRLGMFSYLRRGVRSREMYFVHPMEDIDALRADAQNGPQLWR